jgi:thiamine-phosphate pyrophosphorylase
MQKRKKKSRRELQRELISLISLPRLYAILNASCFPDSEELSAAAEELVAANVTLIQYRNKSGDAQAMLNQARELRRRSRTEPALSPSKGMSAPHGHWARLIMNDRSDLCLAAEFDGMHVGQDDLSPDAARRIIGADRWLGVSTHNPQQVIAADKTSADYVAIGPVFVTGSKANPDPIIGLAGVRQARALTNKPLVAIGGITRENCRSVIEAGADSVAVISDLIRAPRKSAEEFLRILG